MKFKLGDIVFHKKEELSIGCVKDTNGIDSVLVEFGTIESKGYRREWILASDVEFVFQQDVEREM